MKLAELLGSAGRAETVEDRGRAPCCSPVSGAFWPVSGAVGNVETSAMVRLSPETGHAGW